MTSAVSKRHIHLAATGKASPTKPNSTPSAPESPACEPPDRTKANELPPRHASRRRARAPVTVRRRSWRGCVVGARVGDLRRRGGLIELVVAAIPELPGCGRPAGGGVVVLALGAVRGQRDERHDTADHADHGA